MTDPKLRDLIKRQSREAELLIFSYTGSLLATHRKKKKWKKETYFASLPSPVWFSSEYRANGRNTFIEYVPPHSAKTKNAAMQNKGLWWAFLAMVWGAGQKNHGLTEVEMCQTGRCWLKGSSNGNPPLSRPVCQPEAMLPMAYTVHLLSHTHK